jgi:phosphatidate phosphatase PAH1
VQLYLEMRPALLLMTLGLIAGFVTAFDTSNIELADAGVLDCAAPPTGPTTRFNHKRSRLVARLGDSHHRGFDLIATSTAATQLLEGKITYGKIDKDLEDEDVELFVCRDAAWIKLGTSRTSEDGQFALALTTAARLPVGLHDLYVSVVGDRSGARFVGLVAAAQAAIIVSDVDGTLTRTEKSFYGTAVFDDPADVHPYAAATLTAAARRGVIPVYLTARGSQFTDDTRRWLAAQGFPPGPIRFTRDLAVLPGTRTVAYKTRTLAPLATSFKIIAGLGNRASDITAYATVGVPADRIFVKLPEFADELTPLLAAHQAVGFVDYRELGPLLAKPRAPASCGGDPGTR